jgi:hypothetical protein
MNSFLTVITQSILIKKNILHAKGIRTIRLIDTILLMTEAFHQLAGDFDDLPSETRLEDCDYLGEATVHVTWLR